MHTILSGTVSIQNWAVYKLRFLGFFSCEKKTVWTYEYANACTHFYPQLWYNTKYGVLFSFRILKSISIRMRNNVLRYVGDLILKNVLPTVSTLQKQKWTLILKHHVIILNFKCIVAEPCIWYPIIVEQAIWNKKIDHWRLVYWLIWHKCQRAFTIMNCPASSSCLDHGYFIFCTCSPLYMDMKY